MLRKSLLSIINSSLLKKNKCIITCHSILSRNVHTKNWENINMKKLDDKTGKTKLNITEVKKKSTNQNEKYDKYLSDSLSPELLNICLNVSMKMDKYNNSNLYFIDNCMAAKFVSLIIDDLSKDTCFTIELNPAIGILTTELLKADISLIHLYEANKEFDSVLENLSNTYPGRLDRRRYNLLKINRLMYIDRITNRNEIVKIFQGVKSKKWEDKCMQVIGATSTMDFIKQVIYSLLFHNSFMTYGRAVFYMAIPPSVWHRYTCDNKSNITYTMIKVLFQLMFNYKLLGEMKRETFLPWPKKKKRKSRKNEILDEMDYNKLFIVKFEPKIDVYSRLSREDWIKFWYFIRHTMRKRTNRVIPEIEKWVPDSGVKIITQCNHTIFTEFGDLMPEELLKLFKEFQSWPEYKTSTFFNSMKDSLNILNESTILELNAKDDNIHD